MQYAMTLFFFAGIAFNLGIVTGYVSMYDTYINTYIKGTGKM